MRKKFRNMAVPAAAALLLALAGCSGQNTPQENTQTETESAEENKAEETVEKDEESEPESGEEESSEAAAPEEQSEADAAAEAFSRLSVPQMTPEEYPGVNGSTATLPLSYELYHLVTGVPLEEAERTISHSKTTQAYYSLMYGYGVDYSDKKTGLVIAYEPAEEVYETMNSDPEYALEMKPIGKDALVFMANEGNPVQSLAEKQIQDIYGGKIRNWSKVGGKNLEIQAFQRPENSGSQNLMEKLVMKGRPMGPAPSYYVEAEMEGLLEKVAAYNNEDSALGYSVYYYARNMKDVPGLRFMGVNGVMPDNDTIRDESYPYVNAFYAAIRKDAPADSPERKLYDWLTTEDGQKMIAMLGYVPVNDVKTAEVPGAGDISGEFRASGTLDLSENERLILDGRAFFRRPGVFLYDGSLKETDYLEGLEYGDEFGIIDITKPVKMYVIDEKADSRNCGLYLLSEKKWLAEPIFYGAEEQKDGTWECWQWDPESDEDITLVYRDGELFREEEPGVTADKVGENTWREKDGTIGIYGPDGKLIKTLEGADYGMDYGFAQDNAYIMYLKEGTEIAFDRNGNKIFGREDLKLPAASGNNGLWIQRVDPDGNYVWAYDDGTGQDYLWDMKQKKDLVGGDGHVTVDYREPDSGTMSDVYVIERKNGEKEFYSGGKGPLTSSTGVRYTWHAGGGYFGWADSRGIMLENPEKGTMYNVKSGSIGKTVEGSITAIAEDTFFLDGSVCSVWQKDKVLMNGRGFALNYLGDYVAVQDDRNNKKEYIFRKDGSVRYKGKKLPPWITYVDEKVIAAWEGNYFRVLGENGEEVLRIMSPEMAED